jgi:hypothetical protein
MKITGVLKGIVSLVMLNILSIIMVIAQSGGATPDPIPSNAVPIDGGVGFLVAAGVAYGAKKLYAKKDRV